MSENVNYVVDKGRDEHNVCREKGQRLKQLEKKKDGGEQGPMFVYFVGNFSLK